MTAHTPATPCAKHDITGSAIGWQSWCPTCNPDLHRPAGAEPVVDPLKPGDPCPHCGAPVVEREGMFYWRGRSFKGLVCDTEAHKALWNHPGDSFLMAACGTNTPTFVYD